MKGIYPLAGDGPIAGQIIYKINCGQLSAKEAEKALRQARLDDYRAAQKSQTPERAI